MNKLTHRQMTMILASGPDDLTGEEGVGVELCTGADYAVARSLVKRGLGTMQSAGSLYCGLYFNNAEGLELRAWELGEIAEEESFEAMNDLAFEAMNRNLP